MKKEERISPQLIVWAAFAAFTGAVLVVNAAMALFGCAELAYWHYPTLGIALLLVWMELPGGARKRAAAKVRRFVIQAARYILPTSRTARGLAVLGKTGRHSESEPQ